MKKEIHNYPYNSRIGDETKIFLSDQGFTPLNSFESDVLGITPVDPDSQI